MIRKALAMFVCAAALQAQGPHCVQQPRPSLEYRDIGGKTQFASMWACRTANYEDAWDVLVANGVAPIRGVTVAELGSKANQRSRKNVLLTGLRVLQFALPVIPVVGDVNELAYQILFVAGPKLAEEGINFVSGYPDEFQITPSEGGYVTVYSLASAQAIVPKPGLLPETGAGITDPATGEQPAEKVDRWFREMWEQQQEKETEPLALMQNDTRVFMNEAEALSLIGEYEVVAAK
jgi:hypothetical protein